MKRPVSLLLICAIMLSLAPFSRSSTLGAVRPNILLVITDDQRYDTLNYMPRIKARLFETGITFANAFVTTPLCCPSRSSMFTGMYANKHGVIGNQHPLLKQTIAQHLHDNGYYTGKIGKYLNSWDGSPRPEYDFWVDYDNPTIVGTENRYSGYHVYKMRDYALDFLRKAATRGQPFFMIYAPFSPHQPAIPAPGDETLYPNLPLHRPPSFNEANNSDKPEFVRRMPLLTSDQISGIDSLRRKMYQSLNSVDVAVNDLMTQLSNQGMLENTMLVFISDNGWFWGEHRLTGKTLPYEESSRAIFGIHFPQLITAHRVEQRLVANIDIAPTIYELAGIPAPPNIDGRSLVPLLNNTATSWRDDLLIEGWITGPPYKAVHIGRYIYIENAQQEQELYDLIEDPYQLENQVRNPAYATVLDDLRRRLERLRPPTLLQNPRFENDSDNNGSPDEWSINSRFTRSNAVVHGGGYAGRHFATDNANYTVSQTIGNITAGQGYGFASWVNIPSTTDTFSFTLQVRWRNISNTPISVSHVKTYSTATGGWKLVTANLIAPAGATNAQILMNVRSLNAEIYVDNAEFEPSSLLTNGGFEWDANNDRKPDNWSVNSKFALTTTLHGGNAAGRHFATDNSSYTVGQVVGNLTGGRTYRFSGWVNVAPTGDAFTFTLQARWRDANNTVIRTDTIKSYTRSTNDLWEMVTASLTAPNGTTNAEVQMVVSSLNGKIYVDDFALLP